MRAFQLFAAPQYARLSLARIARPCAMQAPATRTFSSVRLRQTLSCAGKSLREEPEPGRSNGFVVSQEMTRSCRDRTGKGNGHAHAWPTDRLEDRERTGRDQIGAFPGFR